MVLVTRGLISGLCLGALVFAGCDSGSDAPGEPDAGGTDPGADSLVVNEDSYEFGVEFDGEMSATESFTITNEGDADTPALSTAINGDGFEIVSDGCDGQVLSPGASCTIEVAFAPALQPADGPGQPQPAETFQADLVVNGGSSEATVSLAGEGQPAATIVVVPVEDEVAIASLDPLGIDVFFDDSPVGDETTTLVTITNIGAQESGTLALGDFEGDHPDDFYVIESTCLGNTLEGGESCTCLVGFTPSEAGEREAYALATVEAPGTLAVDFFWYGTGE